MFEKIKETGGKTVATIKERGPEVGKKCLAVVGCAVGVAGFVGIGMVLAKAEEECRGAGKPWSDTVRDMRALEAVEKAAGSLVQPDDSVDIYEKCNLPENWVELVEKAKHVCLIISKDTVD